MTKFNRNFQLGLKELRIIEEALHGRVRELASQLECGVNAHVPQTDSKNAEVLKNNLADVREVLGHLHNQKIWYEPKNFVPRG